MKVGRHGVRNAHIIRAARYFVVVFEDTWIGISTKLESRRDAQGWISDYLTAPKTVPLAHVIRHDDIEKIVIVNGSHVELITSDRRYVLDSWFNRNSGSHTGQLRRCIDELGFVEQVGARPGTFAREPVAPLHVAEVGLGSTSGVFRSRGHRKFIIAWSALAFIVASAGQFTNAVLVSVCVALLTYLLTLPVRFEVRPEELLIRNVWSKKRIHRSQIGDVDVRLSSYHLPAASRRSAPTLAVSTGRKWNCVKLTTYANERDLGRVLNTLHEHSYVHSERGPILLADFGHVPELTLKKVRVGGAASMWDREVRQVLHRSGTPTFDPFERGRRAVRDQASAS